MTTTIFRKNSKNQIVREVYRNKQSIITGGVEDLKSARIYAPKGKLIENIGTLQDTTKSIFSLLNGKVF